MNAQLSRDLLRAVLRQMVQRELILAEIRRLQLRQVEATEVDDRLLQLRRRFDSEASWQEFLVRAGFRDSVDADEPAPPELTARLRAEAQVDRFLEVRVKLNVVVTDEDVAACYAELPDVFRGASLGRVAPRIKQQLEVQRHGAAMVQLLEQLESRARVRYDPEFEPPPPIRDPEPLRAVGSSFTCKN